MTNEQREAIKKLEYVNRRYDCNNYYSRYELDCIDTVLSLIKEQEKQIENTTENYKNLIEDISMLAKELGLEDDATIDEIYITIKRLKQKDKQIDLMARAIDNYDSQLEINTFKDKEHIKQYFAELVEKE